MLDYGLTSLTFSLAGWASHGGVTFIKAFRRVRLLPNIFSALAVPPLVAAIATDYNSYAQTASVSLGLFLALYVFIFRMPRAKGRPEVGKRLPQFTVHTELGTELTPDTFVGRGPVLFIFYRGFW